MGDRENWASWIERAQHGTRVTLSPASKARIIAGVHRGRRNGWLVRTALVAVTCAAGAIVLWKTAPRPVVAPAPRQVLQFDDAATGEPSPAADAVVAERTARRTRVQVKRGAVRFDVGHTGREFFVEAGPVTVIVLGTAFTVDRRADGVRVSVDRGRVRVEAAAERVELQPGESRFFSLPATSTAPVPAARATPPPVAPDSTPAPPPRVSARPVTARWQALGKSGDDAGAHRLLQQRGSEPPDDVEELLLAADAARSSSHWAEALVYYDRVLVRHGQDPRAGFVAFTKGRLLLNRLGRPADAALAFQTARRLSLPDNLRGDALAREVEAWSRAGDDSRARERAHEYLRRYPSGPARSRVQAVVGDR